MAVKKRIKYMVKSVTIPNATAANTVTRDTFLPDQDYKFITGVRAFIGTPGSIQGGTFVNLELKDSKGDVIELTHMNGWIPDQSVPMSERWRELAIPIDGSRLKLAVENPTLSTAEYKIQFEFRLEDEYVKVANID